MSDYRRSVGPRTEPNRAIPIAEVERTKIMHSERAFQHTFEFVLWRNATHPKGRCGIAKFAIARKIVTESDLTDLS